MKTALNGIIVLTSPSLVEIGSRQPRARGLLQFSKRRVDKPQLLQSLR